MSFKAFIAKKILGMNSSNDDAAEIFKIREKIKKHKILSGFYKVKYNKILYRNNSFIPWSVPIGDGIEFPHGISGIFISNNAVIGENCVIFHQVTIGSNNLEGSRGKGAPIIGNNVYIGAGAKIIGNVRVGNNVRIGANAIVTIDIEDNSTVVMERPRIILNKNILNNKFEAVIKD